MELKTQVKTMIRLPSPSRCVAITSILIALSGAGYSATGGNFLIGRTNTATTPTLLNASLNMRTLQLHNPSAAANATALGLFVANGKPPFYVNSAVKVARLNSDLLDGLTATQFGRIAYAETKNASWSEDGRTTLLTVTLVAPQKGFVTLSGGAIAAYINGCAYCAVPTRFRIDSTTNTSTTGTIISRTGIERYAPLSHTVTVPVNGGTHTYALVGSWLDVSGTNIDPDTWYDPTLSAQFIAFNGAGTTTAVLELSTIKKPLIGRSHVSARSAMSGE